MTPEQVAKNFHSECKHDLNADVGDVWCVVHDSLWHQENCDTMIDYIDLAEQAVEAYQADLRAEVEALRDIDPHYQPVRDAYDAVLTLIDGGSDDG